MEHAACAGKCVGHLDGTCVFLRHLLLKRRSIGGIVPECNFVCPVHSEAKQTETELGVGERFIVGQARRMRGSCSEPPNSPMVFREKVL